MPTVIEPLISPKLAVPAVFRRPKPKRKPVAMSDEAIWKYEQDERNRPSS